MSQFKCRKCNNIYFNQEKFFSKCAKYKSGFDTLCKLCKSKVNKKYRDNNSEYISISRKLRYNKYISHEKYINSMNDDPIGWRAKILRAGMQQRSILSNLDFDPKYFTVAKIKEIIIKQNHCPCCNTQYSCKSLLNGIKNDATPSADRFDNNQGYIKNNVVFICWRCNNLKGNSKIQDLQTVVNWLENKLNTK